MTLVRVNAQVNWKVLQGQGGNWVAICDPLKLTVQGPTFADLMQDIGLTLDALMKDLYEANELHQFLHDRGWTLMSQLPQHNIEDVRFDVPFLPAMIGNGSAHDIRQ